MNDTDKQAIAWNFVEAHYPNFSSSDEIARNGDLTKLSDGEYDEGDSAHQLLMSDYNGDLNNHRIEIDLRTSFCGIYGEAMEEAISGMTTWCFAAEFFPRYSYSELVYRSDLLGHILEGGDCMNEDSTKMLQDEFGGNDSDPQIVIEVAKATFTIFEGAILEFMAEEAREANPSKDTKDHVELGDWTLDIQREDKTFTVKHSSGTKVFSDPHHSTHPDYEAHRFTCDSIDAQIGTATEYTKEPAEVQVLDIEAEVTNDGLFSFLIRGEYTWKREPEEAAA